MIQLPVEPAPRHSHTRAALLVVVAMVAGGVLVGAVWAWLAPPIHGVIALTKSGNRVHAALGAESDNFFLGAALLLGLLAALSVIAAVAAWQWRAHRGPLMAAALTLGSIGACAAAAGVGAGLVRLRYGVVDLAAAPVTPENRLHYVTQAPSVLFGHGPLQVAATLLLPAVAAAVVYAFYAAASPRDDLGGFPPQDLLVARPVAVGQPLGAPGQPHGAPEQPHGAPEQPYAWPHQPQGQQMQGYPPPAQ